MALSSPPPTAAFRVDLKQSAEALPEPIMDEPGKRLSDYKAACDQLRVPLVT